jgi:hypothetical protein
VAPPSDVYRKVGLRLPSPCAKQWGDPTSTTRYRPRSGSLKIRPIRSVPLRVGKGWVTEGSGVGGGVRLDSAKWNRVEGSGLR